MKMLDCVKGHHVQQVLVSRDQSKSKKAIVTTQTRDAAGPAQNLPHI